MFDTIEVLTVEKHENIRFLPPNTYEFAKEVHIVPLGVSELLPASKFYPIVFIDKAPGYPHALLSLVPGTNAYLKEGKWRVPYIPAYIRQYPFTIRKIQGEEDKFTLCLVPDAPHFNKEQGEPLFKADGSLSDFTEKIKDFCVRFFQDLTRAKNLFTSLKEKEIISPWKVNLKAKEKSISLDGLEIVSEDKLKKAKAEDLKAWVERGVMPLIYAHLFSLNNMNFLGRPIKK
jgi:hypothetical protein